MQILRPGPGRRAMLVFVLNLNSVAYAVARSIETGPFASRLGARKHGYALAAESVSFGP